MKMFNLRIFSILILFLFCFAPLGAIDITQDNSTEVIIPDDNSSKIVDDDDVNANETKDNLSSYEYSYFSIHVDDITEGQNALVEVHTYDFVSTGVFVIVDGHEEFLWVDHGYASVEISGLKAGTYKAEVFVQDTMQKNSTTFTVNPKADPNISVNAKNIDSGDRASADIYLDKGYTGNVHVLLDGVESQTFSDVNGYVHVDFNTELDPGQHKIVVTTEDNSDFKKIEKTAEFTVSRTLHVNMEINDTIEGQNPVVKVTTHSKYNGFVLVTSECCDLEFGYAKDGVFTCELHSDDLTEGTYQANVLAFADGPFDQVLVSKTYNIIKP